MKTASSLLLLCLVLTFSGCQQPAAEATSAVKPGMTKITIMYPKSEGSTFDMDYYANKHMPMLKELFGDKMKHLAIDKGISGRLPTDPMPYMAIGYLYFDSIETNFIHLREASMQRIRKAVDTEINSINQDVQV